MSTDVGPTDSRCHHRLGGAVVGLVCVAWLMSAAGTVLADEPAYEPGEPFTLEWLSVDEEPQACGEVDVTARLIDINGNLVAPSPDSPGEITITADSDGDGVAIVDHELGGNPTEEDHRITSDIPTDGEFTVTVTLEDTAHVELRASHPDLDGISSDPEHPHFTGTTIRFGPGTFDAHNSEIIVEQDEIFDGDGAAQITVIPRDGCTGHRLGEGQDVRITSSFGEVTDVQDLEDGRYEAFFSTADGECPDEPAEIDASVDDEPIADSADVDVICLDVDLDSTVVLVTDDDDQDFIADSTSTLACDGGEYSVRLEVFPVASDGDEMPHHLDVGVVTDGPYVEQREVTEAVDLDTGEMSYNVYVGARRCSQAPREMTLHVGGVALNTRPQIEFMCSPLEAVDCTGNPPRMPVGNQRTAEVLVETEDSCGTPGFDRTFELETTGGATIDDDQLTTIDAPEQPEDGTATIEADIPGDQPGSAELLLISDGHEHDCTITTVVEPVRITDPGDGDTVGTRPTISGTAEPNTSVVVDHYEQSVGVDDDGHWSWTPRPYDDYPLSEADLSEGERTLEAWPAHADSNELYADSIDLVIDDRACPDVPGCAPEEHQAQGSGGCISSGTTDVPTWPLIAGLVLLATAVFRRRISPRAVGMVAALVAVIVPVTAGADVMHYQPTRSVNLWHLQPQPVTGNNYVSTSGARTLGHDDISIGAQLGYGHRPLTTVGERHGDEYTVIGAQTHLDTSVAIGLGDGFEIAASIPSITNIDGNDADMVSSYDDAATFAVGDLRLMPKAKFFEYQGIALATLWPITLPTATDAFAGEGRFTIEPRLLLELLFTPQARLGLDVGYHFRGFGPNRIAGIEVNNQFTFRFGYLHRVTDQIEVVGELYGRHNYGEYDFQRSPMELLAATRFEFTDGHHLTAGAGPGLTPAYGTPRFRAFVGYNFFTSNQATQPSSLIPQD